MTVTNTRGGKHKERINQMTTFHVTIKDAKTLAVKARADFDTIEYARQAAEDIQPGEMSFILKSTDGRYRLVEVYEFENGKMINTYRKGE